VWSKLWMLPRFEASTEIHNYTKLVASCQEQSHDGEHGVWRLTYDAELGDEDMVAAAHLATSPW
jgi:hypothetical protein